MIRSGERYLRHIRGGLAWILSGVSIAASAAVDFNRDVAPVFFGQCIKCHGESRTENGLRLDNEADALRGGEHGPAYQSGKSSESLVIQVLKGSHAEIPRMPRKGDPIAENALAAIAQWIDAGAAWPDDRKTSKSGDGRGHWSFRPVVRPGVPGSGHPVDHFVDAAIARQGLKPEPRAEPSTLIRRLHLDLTGLPPVPGDLNQALRDGEKGLRQTIDQLLASPHYGEKWARHWLDAARYADSNGFEKDRTRMMWPWRDWVIQAFNDDMPFDRFTREQLAGDLVDGAGRSQQIATGFLRNSMINMEGGVEPEKFRTETIVDRVDAVGRTWLGLTIACAQCHNHKYDPISQKEYYQFYGLLNQDAEPRIEVPTAEQDRLRREITESARKWEKDLLSAEPDLARRFEEWCKGPARDAGEWRVLDAREWHSTPMKFEKQEDGAFLGGGDIATSGILRIWVDTPLTNISGFRVEARNHPNFPANGPGIDGDGSFQLCEFRVDATPLKELEKPNAGATGFVATTNRIKFTAAWADANPAGGNIANTIDGATTNGGWWSAATRGRRNEERRAAFAAEKPIGFEGGTRLLVSLFSSPQNPKFGNSLIGHVRVSIKTGSPPDRIEPLSEKQRRWLDIPADQRSPEQQGALLRAFLQSDESIAGRLTAWDALWEKWPKADATTLALQNRELPRITRILRRGDYLKPLGAVTPGVPEVLPAMRPEWPRNRLGLAEWIVDERNPLTARVIVNRVWQQYFGTGLVPTPEDFGTRADPPSHPELLDWLASEFMKPAWKQAPDASTARPWSLKHLHRVIVSSAMYQRSSRATPEALEKDPSNKWMARGARYRVDAEIIQDIALASSGLLSRKIGGPSVFPVLPDGVMQLSYGPIKWETSGGDDRYRRALYTFWKRSVPYPALTTFDAPGAEQSCVRRMRSNTPLQALTTLNEPTFNHAARWLAWRVLANAHGDGARVESIFQQCLARHPDTKEEAALLKLLEQARVEFAKSTKEATQFAYVDPVNPPPLPPGVTTSELAAWSAVARTVLNLDETISRE